MIQLCPICTRQTYTILHGLGYTADAACLSRPSGRHSELYFLGPCLLYLGMAKRNGFARVGLLKANAVGAEKSKPGQPCSLVCLDA
jgi:hypothetical protein